jgi:hypothetical protein
MLLVLTAIVAADTFRAAAGKQVWGFLHSSFAFLFLIAGSSRYPLSLHVLTCLYSRLPPVFYWEMSGDYLALVHLFLQTESAGVGKRNALSVAKSGVTEAFASSEPDGRWPLFSRQSLTMFV